MQPKPHSFETHSDLTTRHGEYHHPTLPDLHINIMKFMQDYSILHSDEHAPSVRQIAAAVGFSVGVVHGAIQELIHGGYLRKTIVYQRNLRIVRMPFSSGGEAQ